MSNLRLLERKQVGRTGMRVSPMGLGGAWLGYTPDRKQQNEDTGAATVVRALERGVNLIDTSPLYGRSEVIIGNGLREWYRRGGQRSDVVLSSKTGTRTRPKDYSGAATLRSIERSLQDLGTEYIDIMLVHDPDDLEPVFASGGALDVLENLQDQKVIRAIGLGVRSHEHHLRCINSGRFDISLTYGDMNLLNQSANADILPAAGNRQAGVFNAMVVEYGLLGGRNPKHVAEEVPRLDPLKVNRAYDLWLWAQEQRVDLLSVALQYATRDRRISSILVGASHPQELDADINAYLSDIPTAVWDSLYQHFGL